MSKAKQGAEQAPVQTSAQPVVSINAKPKEKPALHKPTAPRPRDAYSGKAGSYVRDPVTGERKPADHINAETKEEQQ